MNFSSNLFNMNNEIIFILDEFQNIIHLNSVAAALLKIDTSREKNVLPFKTFFSPVIGFDLNQIHGFQKLKMALNSQNNCESNLYFDFSIEPLNSTMSPALWIAKAKLNNIQNQMFDFNSVHGELSRGINQNSFFLFVAESKKLVEIISTEKEKLPIINENLKRSIHTLKTGADIFGIFKITDICLKIEKDLFNKDFISSSRKSEQIRNDLTRVEKNHGVFLNEMQNYLSTNKLEFNQSRNIIFERVNSLQLANGKKGKPSKQRERYTFEILALPLHELLTPYVDWVFLVSQQLNKRIAPLKISSGSIKVIPEIYNSLFINLGHAFKNAIDHGIESPEDRKKLGKNELGQIEILVSLKRSLPGRLHIQIHDDGKGFDFESIRNKLNFDGNTRQLSNLELLEEILKHPLTTKVSDNGKSGQGIGLSALSASVKELDGKIWIESRQDKGTTIHIEVPYIKTFELAKSKKDEAA